MIDNSNFRLYFISHVINERKWLKTVVSLYSSTHFRYSFEIILTKVAWNGALQPIFPHQSAVLYLYGTNFNETLISKRFFHLSKQIWFFDIPILRIIHHVATRLIVDVKSWNFNENKVLSNNEEGVTNVNFLTTFFL